MIWYLVPIFMLTDLTFGFIRAVFEAVHQLMENHVEKPQIFSIADQIF